jgi:tetratricopeptide (TPR) repeat protein
MASTPVFRSVSGGDGEPRLIQFDSRPVEEILQEAQSDLADELLEYREKAITLFLQAAHIAPRDPRPFLGLSAAYRALQVGHDGPQNRRDAAIAFALKAVALAPQDAQAQVALAMAYLRQHWFHLALQHLGLAWGLAPDAHTAYWIGWLQSEIGQLDEDLKWLELALEMDPAVPGLAAELGYAHRALGNDVQAETWLLQAVAAEPENVYVHENLLLLYLAQGAERKAGQHAKKFLAGRDEQARFLSAAGGVAWYAGQRATAQEWLERAVTLDPGVSAGTWGTYAANLLGELYWREGSREEAQAMLNLSMAGYQKRWERASEGWGYRYDMARICALQGDREEAYRWLEDAVAFGWSDYSLARRDPMLARLRREKRFKQLLGEVEEKVAAMREGINREGDEGH